MYDEYDDGAKAQYLVNPSRTAMEQLGRELRAMIDLNDDVYVWRTDDCTHFTFAETHNLCGKAWLYINPASARVTVSTYSHGEGVAETRRHVKSHPKFKYFTVDGLPDEEAQPANEKLQPSDLELLKDLGALPEAVELLKAA
jgi:hypothetical protein